MKIESAAFLSAAKYRRKSEGFEEMDDKADSHRNTGATVESETAG